MKLSDNETAEIKTFSHDEIVQLALIMNNFSSLLEKSNLILSQLQLLQKAEYIKLDTMYDEAIKEWIVDFNATKTRLELFNSKATMH